jgi:hypothetical protein
MSMVERVRLIFQLAKPKELKDKLPKGWDDLDYVYGEPKEDGLRGYAVVKNGKAKLYTAGHVERS